MGLAEPRALRLALQAAKGLRTPGPGQGGTALAPKSNADDRPFDEAWAVDHGLAQRSTSLLEAREDGQDHRDARDEPDGCAAAENWLPEGMAAPAVCRPVGRCLARCIADKLCGLKKRNHQSG